jgi:HK97 family phage major capsid protein
MTEQILSKIGEFEKTFHDFKSVQERSMKDNDALLKEQTSKIVEALTIAQEANQKAERAAAALNRPEFARGSEKEVEAETRKKFDSFLRGSDNSGKIEVRAMQTDNDAQGGYLVRPEFANFTAGRSFETSPLRQVARVVTISGNALTVDIDDDEAAASWGSELGTVSATDTPDVGQLVIYAHKLVAEPEISTEMLQDAAFNIEAWLQAKVADKLSRSENTAFISGTGVDRPKGLLSYSDFSSAGTYTRDALERIASGSNSAITTDGVIALQNSLKEAYQGNAKFLMKRGTFGDIMKLNTANSYNFLGLQPSNKQGTIMELTLLGKPVIFCDDFEANGTQNNDVAAYGDFSVGYPIVDNLGLTVLKNPFRTTGKVIYQVEKRVGGSVTNFEAIKLMDVNAS